MDTGYFFNEFVALPFSIDMCAGNETGRVVVDEAFNLHLEIHHHFINHPTAQTTRPAP